MQVKTGLIHILSRHKIAPYKDTPVPLLFEENSMFLQTKGELMLSFTKIST
jgi:hypothetical protein